MLLNSWGKSRSRFVDVGLPPTRFIDEIEVPHDLERLSEPSSCFPSTLDTLQLIRSDGLQLFRFQKRLGRCDERRTSLIAKFFGARTGKIAGSHLEAIEELRIRVPQIALELFDQSEAAH